VKADITLGANRRLKKMSEEILSTLSMHF